MAKNKKNDTGWCAFPHCRNQSDLIWLGVGVCSTHFAWVCNTTHEKAWKKLQVKQEKIDESEAPCECVGHKKKKGLENFIGKDEK